MRTIKIFPLLTLPFALVLNLEAQQSGTSATPMLSPIPIITAGVAPSNSKQYVFWGPKVSQLTLSYPADLETGAGPRQTYTIKMLNRVHPIVSTVVNELADGSFEYVYSISNAGDTEDAIKVLSLALPATDAIKGITANSWSVANEAAPGHETPLEGAVSMTPVIFSVLRDSKGGGLAPGQTISDIRLRSAYRPGLTLLYSRSSDDYDVPSDLPSVVSDQLAVMRAPEWRNQATVVIGPVYPKTLPRDFVANELSYGVARLTDAGQIQGSSPAVVALKRLLEGASHAGGMEIPTDELRSVVQTPAESELVNAVIISLR